MPDPESVTAMCKMILFGRATGRLPLPPFMVVVAPAVAAAEGRAGGGASCAPGVLGVWAPGSFCSSLHLRSATAGVTPPDPAVANTALPSCW